jgi:hypothetical protein
VQTGYVYDLYHANTPGGVMGVRGDSSGVVSNFNDNKNGTVSDATTGLMWQQNSSPQAMNWQQSLAYCENLELAGFSDWRLPNVHELQSIVDYTRYNPSINTGYFPSTEPTFYYSSTTKNENPDNAWTVTFNYGFVDYYFGGTKDTAYYSRCVRSIATGIKHVSVDFKPGSCPNPIGFADNKGVMPFAIMGTTEFDITQIEPVSIRITREGMDTEVVPIRWSYEDVATPFEGEMCDCHELKGDGYMDMLMKVYTHDLVYNLKLQEVTGDTIPLTVTGKLKDEFGGTLIEGKDCVKVLKAVLKGKK